MDQRIERFEADDAPFEDLPSGPQSRSKFFSHRLWNNPFRNQPRVDLDRQPSCLDCRIRRGQFLRFIKRGDVEDEYAAQISVITKWSSHDELLCVCKALDVFQVGLL